MGLNSKHAYRFVYLKSEQWDDVRLEALAAADAKCRICGLRSIHNDAHHIWYPPSFWNTKAEDLIILCRPCHTLAHVFVTKHKKDREEAFSEWDEMIRALADWRSATLLMNEEEPLLDKLTPKSLREAYDALRQTHKELKKRSYKLTQMVPLLKHPRKLVPECNTCGATELPLVNNAFAEWGPKWGVKMCEPCLLEFKAAVPVIPNSSLGPLRKQWQKMRKEKLLKLTPTLPT